MNKREFLKATALLGAASLIPAGKSSAKGGASGSCALIPSETAGPFPLDLAENSFYLRKDVRETRDGVQLNLKMKIIGVDNCAPMQNVRVNIWHCDKDGLYSGYQTETGLTYLRGYQIADVNGEVEFITIFPGWYPGRTCHIHFQVYVSSSYAAISQLTFDATPKNALYAANPTIYTKGADPLGPSGDNVFADGYDYQVATLTYDSTTGNYNSYLEVSVQGSGTINTGHIEKENAKQFSLGQNFPNPYSGATTIPFDLKQPAVVTIELWNLAGKKVIAILNEFMNTGSQQVTINPRELGLTPGNYIYQIQVSNGSGIFKDCKMMTALY